MPGRVLLGTTVRPLPVFSVTHGQLLWLIRPRAPVSTLMAFNIAATARAAAGFSYAGLNGHLRRTQLRAC